MSSANKSSSNNNGGSSAPSTGVSRQQLQRGQPSSDARVSGTQTSSSLPMYTSEQLQQLQQHFLRVSQAGSGQTQAAQVSPGLPAGGHFVLQMVGGTPTLVATSPASHSSPNSSSAAAAFQFPTVSAPPASTSAHPGTAASSGHQQHQQHQPQHIPFLSPALLQNYQMYMAGMQQANSSASASSPLRVSSSASGGLAGQQFSATNGKQTSPLAASPFASPGLPMASPGLGSAGSTASRSRPRVQPGSTSKSWLRVLNYTSKRDTTQTRTCNCKNSKCLKLYCECFAAGEFCSPDCACANCQNTLGNEAERRQAVFQTLERNPDAFRPKIAAETKGKHTKGCRCKNSKCLKRYCECFQAGVVCTDACQCIDCKNRESSEARRELFRVALAKRRQQGRGSHEDPIIAGEDEFPSKRANVRDRLAGIVQDGSLAKKMQRLARRASIDATADLVNDVCGFLDHAMQQAGVQPEPMQPTVPASSDINDDNASDEELSGIGGASRRKLFSDLEGMK